jgi:general secretion pathway protein M
MNNLLQALGRLRLAASVYWLARTGQERQFLTAGGVVILLALVYAILIAPALDGRERLQKSLPLLRQNAAEMQALARQAGELANQPKLEVMPMNRDSLNASLAARGLTPQSLSVTGEYAKLQFKGVAFPALVNWLDTVRRENRIAVQEANVLAPPTGAPQNGQVDATLTLHQAASP